MEGSEQNAGSANQGQTDEERKQNEENVNASQEGGAVNPEENAGLSDAGGEAGSGGVDPTGQAQVGDPGDPDVQARSNPGAAQNAEQETGGV